MGHEGVVLSDNELINKGVLGKSFSQCMVNEGIATLRDRGPNDYISLRIGGEDENSRFISLLTNAEREAASAAKNEALKASLTSAPPKAGFFFEVSRRRF